jgi:polar amino acid transport system substrate-binding protein
MSRLPHHVRRLGAALAVASAAAACGTVDDGDPAGAFTPATAGVLTVATNLPAPGFWEGPAGAPTGGFEHGLATALADRFGLDSVVVVDVPFERIVAGDLGGADLALAELTPTDERDERLDFTTGYLDANPAVIVRPGTDVEDMAAARELTWVVQAGSTQQDLVDDVVRPDVPVTTAPTIDAVVAAVLAGDVGAGLLDLPTALVEQQLTGGRIVVAAQFGTDDVLAIAVAEGSDDLEALDSAVRAFVADGTVESLADEWLGGDVLGSQVDVPLIRSRTSQITD